MERFVRINIAQQYALIDAQLFTEAFHFLPMLDTGFLKLFEGVNVYSTIFT